MRQLSVRVAVLLLRLPFGPFSRRAIETALRAAESGAPAAVRALVRAARSRRRAAVWRAWLDLHEASAHRWASLLLTELLAGQSKVPDALVDAAWVDWLDEHNDRLWSLLEDWSQAAWGPNQRVWYLSRLALGDAGPRNLPLLVEAATRFDHPIGERARTHLLAFPDQESVDLLCTAGWESADVAAFCIARDLAPSETVVNAAWRDWLDEPGATLWSLLRHWNRPAADDPSRHSLSRLALGDDAVPVAATVLTEAAARFDHPIGEQARTRLLAIGDAEVVDLFCAASVDSPDATAFCVEHRLAPADEVQRAMFFLRTGQHEQYGALDPDGALLALGYRSVSSQERASLRTAMAAAGGIDTLRVLAGRRQRDDLASLTEAERAYLVRRLADQADWERLWALTVSLPLADAVEAADAFGDWRPADTDDRRVFEALRAADPQHVRAFGEASFATPFRHVRIRLHDLDERLSEPYELQDVDIAPDGTQLVIAGGFEDQDGEGGFAGVVNLDSGTISWLYTDLPRPLEHVAHLGSDSAVVAETEDDEQDPARMAKIHYVDRAGVRTPPFEAAEVTGLERIAGERAFVLSIVDEELESTVFTASFDGSPVATDMMFDAPPAMMAMTTVAAPDSRLVAVLDIEGVVVADLEGSVVNQRDAGPESGLRRRYPLLGALSPATVASCDGDGHLYVWQDPLTSTEPPEIRTPPPSARPPLGFLWSSALNRFLAVHDSYVELLDLTQPTADRVPPERIALAEPSRPTDGPLFGQNAWLSPAGDVLAVTVEHDSIDVYTLTGITHRRLIPRPMVLMDHKVLTDLTLTLADPALDEESRKILDLVRVCLECRFRHDVGISETTGTPSTADYDIELGG